MSEAGAPIESVVFLCKTPPFVEFARAELRKHSPSLSFVSVETRQALLGLPDEVLARSRLIGFTTGVIVPPSILNKTGFGAYNFHPGPPEYPGYDPIRFALYAGTRTFGATAHVMDAEIDAGTIIGVRRFDVGARAGFHDLQAGMVKAICGLFSELAPALVLSSGKLPPAGVDWAQRRFTKRMAEELCAISPDIGAEELGRRLRAFESGELTLRPTVTLHGARFIYVPESLIAK